MSAWIVAGVSCVAAHTTLSIACSLQVPPLLLGCTPSSRRQRLFIQCVVSATEENKPGDRPHDADNLLLSSTDATVTNNQVGPRAAPP